MMVCLFLSSSATQTAFYFSNKKPFLCLRGPTPPYFNRSYNSGSLLTYSHNPLRFSNDCNGRITKIRKRRGFCAVSYADPFAVRNLQWISTISAGVLMLARGTAVQKSFLVPLFALQAPASFVSWIKGKYGVWTAFLALLVRLFFFIPGELDLPVVALLLLIVAPYEVINLRGTQQGAIISLVIAGYLAFQHFSHTSLQKAFDQGSIIATVAIICITICSFFLLI